MTLAFMISSQELSYGLAPLPWLLIPQLSSQPTWTLPSYITWKVISESFSMAEIAIHSPQSTSPLSIVIGPLILMWNMAMQNKDNTFRPPLQPDMVMWFTSMKESTVWRSPGISVKSRSVCPFLPLFFFTQLNKEIMGDQEMSHRDYLVSCCNCLGKRQMTCSQMVGMELVRSGWIQVIFKEEIIESLIKWQREKSRLDPRCLVLLNGRCLLLSWGTLGDKPVMRESGSGQGN